MPYVSQKQRMFFNANKEELEKKGVDVDEFNASSKGKKLPETAPKQKKPRSKSLGAVTHVNYQKKM